MMSALELKNEYLENKNYKHFTWVIQGVFITAKLIVFVGVEGLKSHFILIALMRDKYLLHNINEG
jgi:hypothetical protein